MRQQRAERPSACRGARSRAPRRAARLLAGAVCACTAGTASAQLAYTLTLGLAHNDNVNLSADDPIGQYILRPGLGFSYQRTGQALDAQAIGNLQYRDYLGGDFGDSTRGQLDAMADWHIAPQRLDWVFADSLGVQPVNERQPDTPSNEQQVNVFTTGPTLLLSAGGATRARIELRYRDSYAEKSSQFNSHRVSSAGHLIHDLNSVSQVSANIAARQVRFDHPGATSPDYERYDIYAGYSRALSRFNLDLAAGYTKLDLHDGADDDRGALLRAGLRWQPSDRNRFTLDWERQLTDAAETLALQRQTLGVPPTEIALGNATVSPETFLQRRTDLSWEHTGTRFGWSLSTFLFDRDYSNAPQLDQHGHGIDGTLSWQVRPRLSLGLFGNYRKRHFDLPGSTYRDATLGGSVGYQLSQHLSWHLDLTHYRRTSNLTVGGTTQNIVYFWIAWTR